MVGPAVILTFHVRAEPLVHAVPSPNPIKLPTNAPRKAMEDGPRFRLGEMGEIFVGSCLQTG